MKSTDTLLMFVLLSLFGMSISLFACHLIDKREIADLKARVAALETVTFPVLTPPGGGIKWSETNKMPVVQDNKP